MKKKITQYNLYGEETKTILPNFVHCETIESRSKANNWDIKPHLHAQLYQIFLIETGEGFLVLEKTEKPFQAPCIVTIPPNHLHGFRYTSPTNGRVITFSETYLEPFLKIMPQAFLTIDSFLVIPIAQGNTRFKPLISLADSIQKEIQDNLTEKHHAIQSYLNILWIEVLRFTKSDTLNGTNEGITNDNLSLRYFYDFQQNIKKSLSAAKTVKEYAAELNISTVHLTRICQMVTQKSASQVAEGYIITQALKYLEETDYSIAEIAYLLKFNDPAYFSRLFKKHKAVSPKYFRRNVANI
jgi:AraC family transcriptional regulator, transcriptional activator of pobA